MVLILLRHGESRKNIEARHGQAPGELTGTGIAQIRAAAGSIMKYRPDIARIRYGRTRQCSESAQLLSNLLSIPDIRPIDLRPYHLGVADGRSEQEFERGYPDDAKRLEKFRLGLISVHELRLPGSESIKDLDERIRSWWAGNETSMDGTILVLSRSLVLMINAALTSSFPLSAPMYDWAMPPGGVRVWWRNSQKWLTRNLPPRSHAWPNTVTRQVSVEGTPITTTHFLPGYFRRKPTVLIVPGLFSNTRQGPYNLYSRLAFAIARSGLHTITYDPPGSGDSTPLTRSFEGDVVALHEIARDEYGDRPILLTHSAGVAVAQAAIAAGLNVQASIVLAPVTSREQILRPVKQPDDRASIIEPIAVRAGVRYRASYLDKLSSVPWPAKVEHLILAEHDQYVTEDEVMTDIIPHHLQYISEAGHAFSSTKSADN